MKETNGTILCGVVGALVLSGACAGTGLNDVGDIDAAAGGVAANGGSIVAMQGANEGGRAVGGAAGGRGGAGGRPPVSLGGEGGHGGDGGVEFDCPDCTLLAEAPDIRAVWAANERVYWVEYGGFDQLGNYNDDGRLLATPVAGGEAEVIRGGLKGPTHLRVSENFAYVIAELSTPGSLELWRIGLDTAELELLQSLPEALDHEHPVGARVDTRDWFRRYFVVAADSAYWLNDGVIYRLPEAVSTAPEAFFQTASSLWTLLADDSKLLLHDQAGIRTLALSGGASSPLWTSNTGFLAYLSLSDGYLYGIEGTPGPSGIGEILYFARLSQSGGSLERLAMLFSIWISRLRVDGARYVVDAAPWNGLFQNGVEIQESNLSEGTLDDTMSQHIVARGPVLRHELSMPASIWQAWDATDTAIYLGYEDRLYQVARR